MVDFRKLLYAFALVGLIVGTTRPASAQGSPNCQATAVPTFIRAEGYTELTGDIIVTCTGGVAVPAGQGVPAYNISISTTAPITSKITDQNPGATNLTPFNEALLIVNDANTVSTRPLLACGTTGAPGAPYDPQGTGINPGVCTITADGTGGGSAGGTYNGMAGHPNVFQGRLIPGTSGTGIQFVGVPFDSPLPGDTLTFRITNIRVSAVTVSGGSVTGGGFQTGSVSAQINIVGSSSISIPNPTVLVSTIRNGLLSASGTSGGSYPQCGTLGTDGGSVSATEGFSASFKTRNWNLMATNGTLTGGRLIYKGVGNPAYVPAVPVSDVAQNVPGAQYSTESGFSYPGTSAVPSPNPPSGTSSGQASANSVPFTAGLPTGIDQAGTVTNGTRLVFVFSTIPVGSNSTVPNTVNLTNAQAGSGGPITGAMVAVTGFDAAGAGGAFSPAGTTSLSETADTRVIYEVVFADPNTIENATVPVTIHPVVNLGAVAPVNGTPQIGVTAQGAVGFAPFYTPGPGTANPDPGISEPLSAVTTLTALPIARFIGNLSNKFNAFSFTKCSCDLMFPWVAAGPAFTTSIVVANTSLDPGKDFGFTATAQSGRVRFWYYGTAGIDPTGQALFTAGPFMQQSVGLIKPGSYIAHIVSTDHNTATANSDAGFSELKGPFAGYVIAQSEFRYCHGVASITSSLPGYGAQTYLGLVMDNGFNPLPARTTNSGEQFEQ